MGFAARADASKWRRRSAIHRDGANSAPLHFFAKKTSHRWFSSTLFARKNRRTRVPACQNGVAKVLIAGTRPLWRSLFSSLEKLAKKKRKYEKLKNGPGHGGIRRSRLRSQSKRGETQKTEILDGRRSENTFFERSIKYLKNITRKQP